MENEKGFPRMKWGVSILMSLVYSFGAAWFYYLPAKGEPLIDVTFGELLLHFLVLVFLLWIVAIPGIKEKDKTADLVLLTVLTLPAGVFAALLILFILGGLGIETYGVEYFILPLVPFTLAHKAVEGKITLRPFLMAFVYGVIAFAWGNFA
ncbi:hypothetical protein [Thermococcus sp. GR6]|uniref:hypothetical protein n=1 Tax=Thermococcus sp. GR6 TaxID=1638256 RepID=UPI001F108117|nr:hypothetical protein [Thermococcus sp. GR6]